MPIDLDRLRLIKAQPTDSPTQPKLHHFLKGPVPLPWLNTAGRLPGKALHVGVYAWYLAGLNRSMQVRISAHGLQQIGVARHAGYRAIWALEKKALISVERKRGCSPIVTICRTNH